MFLVGLVCLLVAVAAICYFVFRIWRGRVIEDEESKIEGMEGPVGAVEGESHGFLESGVGLESLDKTFGESRERVTSESRRDLGVENSFREDNGTGSRLVHGEYPETAPAVVVNSGSSGPDPSAETGILNRLRTAISSRSGGSHDHADGTDYERRTAAEQKFLDGKSHAATAREQKRPNGETAPVLGARYDESHLDRISRFEGNRSTVVNPDEPIRSYLKQNTDESGTQRERTEHGEVVRKSLGPVSRIIKFFETDL
uniref:Uncharacterized protein n=1 Tax=Rhodosorus marinus TaxID=101924 RepID=A0A7S0BNT7_9RHOD|mmetsp:Transcript_2735/g.3967  ORF Transcript_2735/g.3967 Transcript_2735/m.3967 type:complete len:257 (+) Transcript_2735:80-850(+)